MDPAELDDPAKAEAFLRESLEGLIAQIATMEADAEKRIREFSESHADDPEAISKHTRFVHDQLQHMTEPMKEHRDYLIEVVATADKLRLRQIEIKREIAGFLERDLGRKPSQDEIDEFFARGG
jgi:hypothetical protein